MNLCGPKRNPVSGSLNCGISGHVPAITVKDWSLKGDVMLIGHGRQRTAEAFLVLGGRAAFVVIGEGTPLSR